jgi:hypothetical protein
MTAEGTVGAPTCWHQGTAYRLFEAERKEHTNTWQKKPRYYEKNRHFAIKYNVTLYSYFCQTFLPDSNIKVFICSAESHIGQLSSFERRKKEPNFLFHYNAFQTSFLMSLSLTIGQI